MLIKLYVKDFALIEEVEVEFEEGLNIITGETGAGKSILIGALGIILGERASNEVIRTGSEKAIVEAEFDIERNQTIYELLRQAEIDYTNILIIRREISAKGVNRIFINDTPANLSLLKEIGANLVDLHGQHDHQTLLKKENHIKALDGLIEIKKELIEYNNLIKELKNLIELKKEKIENRQKLEQLKEYYAFQLNEIEKFSPKPGEDKSLESELKTLENAEKIKEYALTSYSILYEQEGSAVDLMAKAKKLFEELCEIDSRFVELKNQLVEAIETTKEISSQVREYADRIEYDPFRIEQIKLRLQGCQNLKKKYGGSIEAVIKHKEFLEKELSSIEDIDEILKSIDEKIESLRKEAGGKALRISSIRKSKAKEFERNAVEELKELGMPNAKFEAKFKELNYEDENYIIVDGNKKGFNSLGIDEVEFYISTNPGEELRPLSKTASGGEISRIMLALKSIMTKNEKLPLLIFDEIDVGVSGRIAQKVGFAMKNLSRYHQIIAITHLPQIAALADHHILIEKSVEGNRTKSKLRKLSKEERIYEVAKLLSGEKITDSSLEAAKDLIAAKLDF